MAWGPLDRALVALARRTPLGRGALRRALARRLRGRVGTEPLRCTVHGAVMELALDNTSDAKALLGGDAYQGAEAAFIRAALAAGPGDFVDVGANTGTLAAAALAAPGAHRVIAIEANPQTAARLRRNLIDLNPALSAKAVIDVRAVATAPGALRLQVSGRGMGRARLAEDGEIEVAGAPLETILAEHGVSRVACMKIDIEGAEDAVMAPFFDAAPDTLLPAFVIAERPKGRGGAMEAAMARRGYRPAGGTAGNAFHERR